MTIASKRETVYANVQEWDFVKFVAFGANAEYAHLYLKKKSSVGIIGTERTREWHDGDQVKNVTERVALTIEHYSKAEDLRVCGIDDGEQLTMSINPGLSDRAREATELVRKGAKRS
jgi:single-stranded DNA-binding protein